jgi:uncharacterized protein
MKYLVLLLVIGVVLWIARARSARVRGDKPAAKADTKSVGAPQAIVPCAHCGVHLPRAEAVPGALGHYCSEAHRLARGDTR